jgi:hypothetical protein
MSSSLQSVTSSCYIYSCTVSHHTLAHILTHTSLSQAHTLAYMLSHVHSHILMWNIILIHTLTDLALMCARAHTQSLPLSVSLMHSHTHTHTQAKINTGTYSYGCTYSRAILRLEALVQGLWLLLILQRKSQDSAFIIMPLLIWFSIISVV